MLYSTETLLAFQAAEAYTPRSIPISGCVVLCESLVIYLSPKPPKTHPWEHFIAKVIEQVAIDALQLPKPWPCQLNMRSPTLSWGCGVVLDAHQSP